MGCFCTRVKKEEKIHETKGSTQYSWDKRRQNINISDYTIENLENDELVKLPGSVNGEQIIIQNCSNSTIYILDCINSLTVDDCINCKIILGPVQGCVFLRNCNNSTLVTACSQFRTRDCRKLNIFLFCITQPIIEASVGIHFGSYQLSYDGICEHLIKTGLNVMERKWDIIYDFTPVDGEINWSFIEEKKVSEFIFSPDNEETYHLLRSVNQSWKTVIQNQVVCETEPDFIMESSI